MNNLVIKTATAIASVVLLFSTLSTNNPIWLANWSLYYTGAPTGSHLSQTYQLPLHDHYRVACTNSNIIYDGNTKVSFNGIVKRFYAAGSWVTFDYYGTSKPNISFQLEYPSGSGACSMSGDIRYYDD